MATDSDGDPDWEAMARDQLDRRAERLADDVADAIRTLGGRIGRGTADPGDLVETRKLIEEAIHTVEDDLAPAAGGSDHGSGDQRYIRNDGAATDYLGLTTGQANEARAGATVELDRETTREVARGHTVQVETSAGIEVTILPIQADPITHELTLRRGDLRRLLNGETVHHGLGDGQTLKLHTADLSTENTGP